MMNRSYSELISLPSFEERYKYLRLQGRVGSETFGYDRYLNQLFYRSPEWKRFRRDIILRDDGCDLGIEDRPIHGLIIIHHINPISPEEILQRSPSLFDFENVICVSDMTHKAIHYGDESLLFLGITTREPGDTCPWK